jgi:thioredoxin 1
LEEARAGSVPPNPQRIESQRLRSILSEPHARHSLAVLTDENFVEEVLDATGLVVFDFWSGSCAQSALMLDCMRRLAETYAGKAKFGRVEIGRNPELVRAFDLKAIPSLAAILDGDVVLEIVGDRPYEEFVERLAPFVATASTARKS